jgi:hypothetical protein
MTDYLRNLAKIAQWLTRKAADIAKDARSVDWFKSERIAGLLFFAGNGFLIFSHSDTAGKAAGFLNISACAVAALFGPMPWGYSLSYAFGAAGALSTIASNLTGDNHSLQWALAAQALVQTAGAFRYPLQRLQPFLTFKLVPFSDSYERNIRSIVGSSLVILKVPTILAAGYGVVALGQSPALLAANLTWATGDVLLNRLHQHAVIKAGLQKLGF